MDGVLTLESIVLAVDSVQPYVLSWSLDPAAEELAECTVLALMRREAGVLLAVPIGFLPDSVLAEGALGSEESIFGPHKVFKVASLLEEGGILSQTGVYIDVLVVDYAAEI